MAIRASEPRPGRLTYGQAAALAAALLVLLTGAAIGSAVASQSVVAGGLALLAFLVGLALGWRVTGQPQPETAASRTLRQWSIPIVVIGGMFVLPRIEALWPGSVFGAISIVLAVSVGYLVTNIIQTRRRRVAKDRELQDVTGEP